MVVIGAAVAVYIREVGLRMMMVACLSDHQDHNTELREEGVGEGDCECIGCIAAVEWEVGTFHLPFLRLQRLLTLADSQHSVSSLATLQSCETDHPKRWSGTFAQYCD